MVKKEKRVPINALEKVAKEQFPEQATERWFDIEVTIKRSLSLKEMLEFVREVVDACFIADGTFIPEVMDFAVKSGILTHYANFTLPDNLEKQYWLIYSTDAVDMVCQHINMTQLQEMVGGINRKIDYLCNTDIIATKAKLDELFSSFNNIGERLGDVFGNIDADDLQKIVQAIGPSGLDDEKVVSAYLKAQQDTMISASSDD